MLDQCSKKAWFGRSVNDNLDAMFGAALRLTRVRADAEDLVADTVTAAWKAVDSLEDRDRFTPWIFRILRNRFLSDCRRRSIRPEESPCSELFGTESEGDITTFLEEQPDDFLKWWSNPEKAFFNGLLGAQIREAIDQLPDAFRTVVLLINVDGLRYDEAANVLGVPTGTVRSRMKRGRTLLQKALWEQASEAGLAPAIEGRKP